MPTSPEETYKNPFKDPYHDKPRQHYCFLCKQRIYNSDEIFKDTCCECMSRLDKNCGIIRKNGED